MFGFKKAQKTEEHKTPVEIFEGLHVFGHFRLALPALDVACLRALRDPHVDVYADLQVTAPSRLPLWLCHPLPYHCTPRDEAAMRAAERRSMHEVYKLMEQKLIDTVGVQGVTSGLSALLTKVMSSDRPLAIAGISIRFTGRGHDAVKEIRGDSLPDLLARAESDLVGWHSPELEMLRELLQRVQEVDDKGIPRALARW